MTVDVIIVNWNSGLLLAECLRHLRLQTVQPTKIYVVDNASSDSSATQVATSGNVVLFQMHENLGFAKGNNWAIKQCTAEYVALLNPDAFAAPEWIEQLLKATVNNPDVAVFGSRQLSQHNPDIMDGAGDVYHMSGLVWRDRHGVRQQSEDMVAREIFSPCAAASMYRRTVLLEVGGFDEDYFCYVEDVDLGFRLRLAGHKAWYVPNAVVHHVGSATTGGQHSDFSIYHGHRNLVWTFVKNMPGCLFWLLLPLHLLMNLITTTWFVAYGKRKVILRAKRDALLALPKIWDKRKSVQRSKVAMIRDIWPLLDKRIYKK